MKLHISKDLLLPKDAVTETFVVYGQKGMGKTVLGAVLAEELARNKLKFCYLDPIGPGYGLRYSADGKGKGLDVLILGGRHGDLPIEPTGGSIVADLVVDENVNTVIDISRRADGKMWGVGERIRFVADYCARLYERQGEKCYPMMQIIDESGRFVPQQIPHGAVDIARCVGAIEQLVELGRNVGVGVCLITQRSARMNKSVSELAEVMIAFRTIGPNSVAAILDWLGDHIPKERWKEMLEALRQLPKGQALIVSPGWLHFEGIATIRMRNTFDSSATPTADRQIVAPATLESLDLEKYRQLIAATIERAKENDPARLKKEIAALKRELAEKPVTVAAHLEVQRVEVPVIDDTDRELVGHLVQRIGDLEYQLNSAINKLDDGVKELRDRIARKIAAVQPGGDNPALGPRARALISDLHRMADRARNSGNTSKWASKSMAEGGTETRQVDEDDADRLPKGEHKILRILAQYPGTGVTRNQLTILSGYKRSSRDAYVARLKARGFVCESQNGDKICVSGDGFDLIGPNVEPLPTGDALREHWLNTLPVGERNVLQAVCQRYPGAISREEIDEKTGYKRSSRDAYLSRLAARKLIEATSVGLVRAAAELFS